MVNSNKKVAVVAPTAPSITPVATSNTVGAATGSGGTVTAASSQGVIPGASAAAKRSPRAEITQIVQGLGTQFPTGHETLLVTGQSLAVSSLITTLAVVLGLYSAVDSSVQAAKSARLALKAALPGADSLISAIKVALVALFGKGNPILENFGLSVSPRRQLTVEEKSAAKAKAAATRVLRGTQGKRKKASVKYLGTAVVQTSLSGAPAASGNAPPTGTNPSTAGAPTGVPSAGSGNPAAGSGSGS
jgi:hypothetical protein